MALNIFTGSGQARPRELTGRMVLLWLIGFFGVVAAVNAVMMGAAISTLSGLDSDSPYQAGLAYEAEIAAARAQQALHWQVDVQMERTEAGMTLVEITARDADGTPLPGLRATASLVHPTDRRLDRDLAVTPDGPGQFRGVTGNAVGQWDVVIELSRDGARQFRTKNRVFVR
jgi:nitrogen fixation protein FixH